MEEYLKNRPHKKVISKKEIELLRNKAIDKIRLQLLPDDQISKIVLIGSSVKDSFGAYDPPGFRGSLYSDFDFIVFVEDGYKIPKWLNREPDGKPFPDNSMNLAFRNKKFIDDKYDIEVFFLRRNSFDNPIVQEQGESAGIPMASNTKHKNLIVYDKEAINKA
jgi:hypothetical protein